MKTITTENLYLRQLSPEDITAEYISALNDQEVVRLTGARFERWDEEKVKRYVEESNRAGISLLIGIFLKNHDKHIGNIRLFNFDKNHDRVELGIMIFDKSQWGKGYGTESLGAVEKYVFEDLGLHKICADYYSVNVGSARIFEKMGFVIEGVFKEHFQLDGKYVDSIRIAKFND